MNESNNHLGVAAAEGIELLRRYNCGPVTFTGNENALYERHLTFDQVMPVKTASPRDKFEAIAHSVRDVLSQRWLKTGQTYQEFVAGYNCTGTEQPAKLSQSGNQVSFNLTVVNNCTGAAQYYTGTDTVRGGKIVAAYVTSTG